MSLMLRQSTAIDVLIGPFLDESNATDSEEAETPVVLLSKNGQALTAKSDVTVPTHDDGGYYNCELDATDTDTVGTLVLVVEDSTDALPIRHEFQIIEEATYDFLYASGATPMADVNAEADTALADYDGPTATELVAEIDAVQSDIAALNDPDVAAIADAIWDEALADHIADDTFGAGLGNQVIRANTVAGGSTTTVELDASASGATGQYEGMQVTVRFSATEIQTRMITAYNSSTKVCTVDKIWNSSGVPASGNKFVVWGLGTIDLGRWRGTAPLGLSGQRPRVFTEVLGASLITMGSFAAGSITALALGADAVVEIVDAIMRTPTSITEAEAGGTPSHRTLYGVIAALMHKAERDGGDANIVLYESDDTTVLVTIPITKDSGLDPIQTIDPPA